MNIKQPVLLLMNKSKKQGHAHKQEIPSPPPPHFFRTKRCTQNHTSSAFLHSSYPYSQPHRPGCVQGKHQMRQSCYCCPPRPHHQLWSMSQSCAGPSAEWPRHLHRGAGPQRPLSMRLKERRHGRVYSRHCPSWFALVKPMLLTGRSKPTVPLDPFCISHFCLQVLSLVTKSGQQNCCVPCLTETPSERFTMWNCLCVYGHQNNLLL